MLWFVKRSPDHDAALDRVRAWTRARFKLAAEATILVSEIACGLPGCPPIETVIVFWTDGDTRHQFKLFKRAVNVVEDDLPPTWMKPALIAPVGIPDECC